MSVFTTLCYPMRTLAAYMDCARKWLREQRHDYSIHDSVWSLLNRWDVEKERLLSDWQQGQHDFQPQKRYTFGNQSVAVFEAADALLLKTLQLTLEPAIHPYLSQRLYHIKNSGGIKAALRDTMAVLGDYSYVFKSDIKGFYASIDHQVLLSVCREFKLRPNELSLINASLARVEEKDMRYTCYDKGIPKGSPLSPLLGSMVLDKLDKAMEAIDGVYYARYMDDWVVLCKTRNQLRKVIKITYRVLNTLKLDLHPDKTYLGRIAKGFDFLGHRLNLEPPPSVAPADTTLQSFLTTYHTRYAQGASTSSLVDYVRRFTRWCRAGLQDFFNDLDELYGFISDALANEPSAHEVIAVSLTLDREVRVGLAGDKRCHIHQPKRKYHENQLLKQFG